MKLTAELIAQAAQYTNAIRDRELDLRGYKIPTIENLGSTLDQFDTIDFSENDIRKLEGFPLLRRLKCLLLNNNRIIRLGDHLETNLPNLESLILTNNNLQELGDIDCLVPLKHLNAISLLRNPITAQKHYRLYVIYRLPQLRVLDFSRIKQGEREGATALFKGKKGTQLARELGKKVRTFVPGAGLPAATGKAPLGGGGDSEGLNAATANGALPKQDIEAIKAAIDAATTLEEVERLNRMLQSGLVPGRDSSKASANGSAGHSRENGNVENEEEEMDT